MLELAKQIVEMFENEFTDIYTVHNIRSKGLQFALYLAAKAYVEKYK